VSEPIHNPGAPTVPTVPPAGAWQSAIGLRQIDGGHDLSPLPPDDPARYGGMGPVAEQVRVVGHVDAVSYPSARVAPRTVLLLQLAAGLGVAVTIAWVSVVVATIDHGFAVNDEGYYLLMYRWWDSSAPNFTGVQYVYGPVFELLGYSIPALRVVRLLTVVGGHMAFGWAFMTWLRTRRPQAPATLWWEIAGAALILASGGMVYSWLPLSPGYNDVSIVGGLLAGAVVLRVAADVERERPIPAWFVALLGPIAVAMLLAKWPSAILTLALVTVVLTAALARRGWRELLRLMAAGLGGLLLTVVAVQLFIAPLTSVVPDIIMVNRQIGAAGHSPGRLLALYVDEVRDASFLALTANLVLLVAAAAATLVRGRLRPWLVWPVSAIAVIGLTLSAERILDDRTWVGGSVQLNRFAAALIGLLFVPLAVGLTTAVHSVFSRGFARSAIRHWLVLAMLFALPLAPAAGSDTGLLGLAVDSLAAWLALVIVAATSRETSALGRSLTAVVLAGLLVMAGTIAVTGLWWYPYYTAAPSLTTTPVAAVPALAGIKLDPATASVYQEFRERLRPWIEPAGRGVMAYDMVAGVVLILDGRPVGEAWVSPYDPVHAAVSMRADCLRSDRSWGQRAPILLFTHPVTAIEVETLRVCGYNFDTDYRLLAPPEQTLLLHVYVPSS
jgi:hypothetical protein